MDIWYVNDEGRACHAEYASMVVEAEFPEPDHACGPDCLCQGLQAESGGDTIGATVPTENTSCR